MFINFPFLLSYLKGLSVLRSLKTLKTPNIRWPLPTISTKSISNNEMPTSAPSIWFQPLERYVCEPISKPFARTF